MLPSYKMKQTEAYIQSLPPTYDEIDLNSSSPPPAYIITDLEVILEEDEHKIQHVWGITVKLEKSAIFLRMLFRTRFIVNFISIVK